MDTAPSRSGPNARYLFHFVMAIGVGVLGIIIAHHPMIASGFRRIQTDLSDSRFNHYLLEHGYRWVRREPLHLDFWSPPFFYPAKNAAAYSDVLLGVGPVYWLWRVMGASPDQAFGLWMLSMSALNYAAGFLLFRRGLGFGMPAAAAGAALVAFGAPRLNQIYHQQLLPFFYLLLVLYALSRLATELSLSRRARVGYWLLAMAAFVAQLYTAVYLAWFLLVGLGLAALVALVMRPCREVPFRVVARDAWAIAAAGAGGLLLLQPFLSHYLPAAREVQAEYLPTLRQLHPSLWSWFDMGPRSWFWGWAAADRQGGELTFVRDEHRLGIGMLTPVACALGFYLGRSRPICRLALAVAFLLWLATTYMPGNQLVMIAIAMSLYCAAGLFYEVERPGLRGIGLAVATCGLLVLRFLNPYETVLALTVIILCVMEIGRTLESPRDWVVPGVALGLISLKLFAVEVMMCGLLVAAVAWVLMAYHWGRRSRAVGFAAVTLAIMFSVVITYTDQHISLIATLAAVPISLALCASPRYRLPAGMLLNACLIALPVLELFYNHDSLWFAYSWMIPGAVAIRAIGRVVLILVVAAALGLAFLVEFLDRKHLAVACWAVALLCLAEQGVTTNTFDAAANRAAIDGIANRIDRGRVAFYYLPIENAPFYLHHLDAMWASLATGVPTVNGYSGHAPRSWHTFFKMDFDPEIDVEATVDEWEQSQGLLPNHVQLIEPDQPAASWARTRRDPSS